MPHKHLGPLNKQSGQLLRTALSEYVFRVYESNDKSKFTDYYLRHYDMNVEIDDDDVHVYEDDEGRKILDHSPATLKGEIQNAV